MNEKLSYAEMLDIPYSTSLITVKQPKKRPLKKLAQKFKKVKDHEEIKNEVIEKVNSETETQASQELNLQVTSESDENKASESTSVIRQAKKKKFKMSVVGVQFAVIGALLLLIVFTNAFLPNSALNAFMGGAMGSSEDLRTYQDFSPKLTGGTIYEGGVYTLSNSSSVYSPCDGVVESLEKLEDGTYTAVIKHSENFSSIFSGLDYVYYKAGDTVLTKVPIGYNTASAELCFTGSDGAIITGWTISGEEVKWAV